MPKQFSSALRKSEFDSRNARILTLVEPTRDQGKVALRVEALSKRYGEREAVADVSRYPRAKSSRGELVARKGPLARCEHDVKLTSRARRVG